MDEEYCDDDRHYIRPKRPCTGKGECLEQNCDRSVHELYVKSTDYTCTHNCEPVKCPNFAVCGEICPQWLFNCHRGRCIHCKTWFGKDLTFPEEDQYCPICFDTKPSVVQPNCTHSVCIDCFKRTRVDGPPKNPEPPFPFPEQEDEYFETGPFDPPHPLDTDPVSREAIRSWNTAMDVWEDEWCARRRGEENLRKCPICRS
jgi:hypothetical protein